MVYLLCRFTSEEIAFSDNSGLSRWTLKVELNFRDREI